MTQGTDRGFKGKVSNPGAQDGTWGHTSVISHRVHHCDDHHRVRLSMMINFMYNMPIFEKDQNLFSKRKKHEKNFLLRSYKWGKEIFFALRAKKN